MNIIGIIGIVAVIANLLLAIKIDRWKILSPDEYFKDVKPPLFVAFLCLLALFLHNAVSLIIIPIALAFELHFLNCFSLYKKAN